MFSVLGHDMDTNMCQQQLRQYVDQLNEMAWMLAETEQRTLELSWTEKAALLFAAERQQWFWAFAGALALLCMSRCCLWRRSYKPGSSYKHGSSRILEEEWEEREEQEEQEEQEEWEEQEEQEEQKEDPLDVDKYMPWHLLKRQEICGVVEDLVYDLLSLCRFFTEDFNPQVQPAIGLGGINKSQGYHFYHLLVPLKPPTGYSFHIKLGTESENPDKRYCVHVCLVCTCMREQLLGNVICQVHHSKDNTLTQKTNFLEAFCTSSSYLDVQKTTSWLQKQMTLACSHIDQAPKHSLTVVPSTCVCTLKLTDAFNRFIFIRLALAVQQGNSGKFVTLM